MELTNEEITLLVNLLQNARVEGLQMAEQLITVRNKLSFMLMTNKGKKNKDEATETPTVTESKKEDTKENEEKK